MDVQNFIRQQLGCCKWQDYDSSLQRLRCNKNEEFQGVWGVQQAEEDEVDSQIFACKFAQKSGYEHLLALVNEDGKLVIHDTSNKEPRYGKQIHQNAIFDIAWLPNRFKLITVSGDHTARLIDIGESEIRMEQMYTGHTRSVKTVAVKKHDSSVFATGSRDGSIRVWDIRTSQGANYIVRSDRTISNSHCRTTPISASKRKIQSVSTCVSAANSVTGLVFQNENTLISCGAGDGLIKVWDLRKTYTTCKATPHAKYTIPYSGTTTRNGYSNLIVDPSGLKLYANCLDNTIYCYNIATYNTNPIREYKGHQNSTFYIKSVISDDGLYLLSGSSDHNAYIWNIRNEEPLVKLAGHTAEVTCVAWKRKGDLALITCSDDFRHKIWRIGSELLPDNWEITGRGAAESLSNTPRSVKRFLTINENTPQSVKRVRVGSSGKRRLEDTALSNAKRLNTGRKLFDVTNSRDEDALAQVLEEEEEVFKTPTSSSGSARKRRLMDETTPPEVFSPTTNLPNFVVDGSAPHLHFSPQKKQDKDWLTKMRVEKRLVREMQDLAAGVGPSTSKSPRLDERSPRSRAPRRRSSRSNSQNSQTPILKFFRVTNNSIMKDAPCSPKSVLSSPSQVRLPKDQLD